MIFFSYRNYSIENNVKNCGEKGISVGEASNVNIQNLKAYNSNIGVASKDSSKVNLNKMNFLRFVYPFIIRKMNLIQQNAR